VRAKGRTHLASRILAASTARGDDAVVANELVACVTLSKAFVVAEVSLACFASTGAVVAVDDWRRRHANVGVVAVPVFIVFVVDAHDLLAVVVVACIARKVPCTWRGNAGSSDVMFALALDAAVDAHIMTQHQHVDFSLGVCRHENGVVNRFTLGLCCDVVELAPARVALE
jgi:hypothetical protein